MSRARRPLTSVELSKLRQLAERSGTLALWAKIVLAAWEGASLTQIARKHHTSRSTASRVASRFETRSLEALADQRAESAGRRRSLQVKDHEAILEMRKQGYTLQEISGLLGISYSKVWRELNDPIHGRRKRLE